MTPEERYAASGIWVDLASSLVRSARYEGDCMDIDLCGRRYRYHGVPISEFVAMLRADSPGRYYNLNIKGKYECDHISG